MRHCAKCRFFRGAGVAFLALRNRVIQIFDRGIKVRVRALLLGRFRMSFSYCRVLGNGSGIALFAAIECSLCLFHGFSFVVLGR
jgi:hypothetical protein